MSMYEVIGTQSYNLLLADPEGADVIAIPCEPGHGVVAAGTVMYRTEDGFWAPAADTNVSASNQLAVLAEKVDTTGLTVTEGTVAEDAAAYRAGKFVDGAVTLASAAALSAANKAVLRGQGIVFEQKVSTGTFNNVKA